MPDPTDFTTRLAQLAPEVDEAASRELFERRRRGSTTWRWAMPAAAVLLVVVAATGLVVINARDDRAPADRTDTAGPEPIEVVDPVLRPSPGETLTAGEEHFDVLTVAETTVGFGIAALVTSDDELTSLWAEWNPRVDQPAVDFDRFIALVMTRPDDACAAIVTRFDVTDQDDTPVWTPVFESQVSACEQPLLSWIHVVAIDRTAIGERALFKVPADEVFDVAEQIIEYRAEPPRVTLTATDVEVPLPPVGEPALHNTAAGLFYVVQHEGGGVSVLPATVEGDIGAPYGVTMLRAFLFPSNSGLSFAGNATTWDAWGRGVTAGRSSDLVGYAGRVDGDTVEIMLSDATRIDGDPSVPDGETYDWPRDLWEPITPLEWTALSSTGPIWRLFDAHLVVEDGVGRICEVDTSVPFVQQAGCDEASVVIDTLVTSTGPDSTYWAGSPVLALQDPVRGFTYVAPLSGWAERGNDALIFGNEGGVCPASIVTAEIAGQAAASEGANCFVTEVEAGRPVVWDLLQFTVEGGPIPARFAFDGETIVRTVDTTRDPLGSQTVTVDVCTGAQPPAAGSPEPLLLGCRPSEGHGFDWNSVPT